MSAVCRTKCVAHEQTVAQRRQLFRERLVVGLFFGVVADVFEQQHPAVSQRATLRFGLRTHAVRRKVHGRARQFRQARRHRLQAVFRIGLALGTPQVRRQHQTCAALPRQLDRR